MEKEFIPYEQALALKELGFDEPCFVSVDSEGKNMQFHDDHTLGKNSEIIYGIYVPLYQQAFRWFRENYSLNHFIDSTRNEGNYKYSIFKREKSESVFTYKWNVLYNSRIDSTVYEEAELECLKKLIEIVKDDR